MKSFTLSQAENIGGSDNKVNQDVSFSFKIDSSNNYLLGAFDGHGTYGKEAAEEAARAVKQYFITNWNTLQNAAKNPTHSPSVNTIFNNAFAEGHKAIFKKFLAMPNVRKSSDGFLIKDNQVMRGGTTATVVAIVMGKYIITGNVGDSDAILLRRKNRTLSVDAPTELEAVKLTADHTPTSKAEYTRIAKLRTAVRCAYECCCSRKSHPVFSQTPTGVARNLESIDALKSHKMTVSTAGALHKCTTQNVDNSRNNNNNNDSNGLETVYDAYLELTPPNYQPSRFTFGAMNQQKNSMKLTVTRSLGDFFFHVRGGVIYAPYVSQMTIDKDMAAIFCGSDGIWDCWLLNNSSSSFATAIGGNLLDGASKSTTATTTTTTLATQVIDESLKRGKEMFGPSTDNMSVACAIIQISA